MRYIGLVRNVMVGREGLHRDVLLRRLQAAGAREGRSHLATGNVSFDADPAELDGVVQRFEAGIAQVIGRREPVMVRTAAWFRELVASEPFRAFPADLWQPVAWFLPLDASPLDAAELRHVDGIQVVAVRRHELLAVVRRGVQGGPLSLLPQNRNRSVTLRTWGTVGRLARLGSGEGGPG